MKKFKKAVSLLLIIGMLIVSFPMNIFARSENEGLAIELKNSNTLEVVEDGVKSYIEVDESDDYRNVYVKDEEGNTINEFIYDKESGTVYSSLTKKSVEIENSKTKNKILMRSSNNDCKDYHEPTILTYQQIIDIMGAYITEATLIAGLVACVGINISAVLPSVLDTISKAIDVYEYSKGHDADKHGLIFYYGNPRCRYNHRAQRYVTYFDVVRKERF